MARVYLWLQKYCNMTKHEIEQVYTIPQIKRLMRAIEEERWWEFRLACIPWVDPEKEASKPKTLDESANYVNSIDAINGLISALQSVSK